MPKMITEAHNCKIRNTKLMTRMNPQLADIVLVILVEAKLDEFEGSKDAEPPVFHKRQEMIDAGGRTSPPPPKVLVCSRTLWPLTQIGSDSRQGYHMFF